MENFERVINAINVALTSEDIEAVSPAIGEWMEKGTTAQKEILKLAVGQLNLRLAQLTAQALESAEQFLSRDGKQYPLSDWLTPKEYAKRFDLRSTQVITNWIRRGVIPKENVVTIQELNNLTLVEAVPYR